MAWSFQATCINGLAKALAASSDSPGKVQKLLDYCPAIPPEKESCVLNDRALAAVTALGLFAVNSQLKFDEDVIVDYLVRLLKRLPSAVWSQNTQLVTKRDGMIAEQFGYKLVLILTNVSTLSSADNQRKIVDSVLTVFQEYSTKNQSSDQSSHEEQLLVTVPALIGLARALQSSISAPREAFKKLFDQAVSNEGERQWDLSKEDSIKLFKLALDLLSSYQWKVLDSRLEAMDNGKLMQLGYPYRFLSTVIQYSLINLIRDLVINSSTGLGNGVRVQVLKMAESLISVGVNELSTVTPAGSNERAFHITKVIIKAVEALVWAVNTDREIEQAFQRFSGLLTVHTAKFSVLVAPLRAAMLEGIAALAEKSPSLVSLALNRFKEFLNSSLLYFMYADALSSGNLDFATAVKPQVFHKLWSSVATSVHVSRADAFTTVQLALGRAVCRTLLAGSGSNSDCVDAFLASLGNQLYTTDATVERNLRVAECIVMLLGQVAVEVRGQHRVISQVSGIFQQRLFHPTSNLDGNIVIELGKMAASTGDSGTIDVLIRLMGLSLGEPVPAYSQRERETSFSHIYQPVVDSLVHVAMHLEDNQLRFELLDMSIQLFVQQGIEARRASERADATTSHKATSSSFSLGLLLPVISTLIRRLEPFYEPSTKVVKLFRDFWLYCIIMGFSDFNIGVFPSAWYADVREIALRSPLLLSKGAEKFLDKELEINHPLKIENIAAGELQEARQSLIDQLGKSPELDRLVYRLTFVQCMYIQSINRLESLRLENTTETIMLVFRYLEDRGLQGELWIAIEMIANKLFNRFLELMEAKPADAKRASELEALAQLLLFKFNHLKGRIKQVADRYLTKLVDKFPHLLWSKTVIHTMLDLLQELSLSLKDLSPRLAVNVKLAYLEHSITLPDKFDKREKTVSYFATRCQQIIELAIKWTPLETKAILEDYISGVRTASVGLEHHSAVSLATSIISKNSQLNEHSLHLPSTVTNGRAQCIKDSLSQPLSSLYLQSRSMGEVLGALQLSPSGRTATDLSSLLSAQVHDAVKSGAREQIAAAMYKATALQIVTTGLDRSLLYTVSQVPVRQFSSVALSVAVGCWQWLLTNRPDLEYPFMREFSAAWKWTIDEKMGIFSTQPAPSATLKQQRPPPLPVKQHMILIQFLEKRLNVVKTRDSAQVSLIVEILHNSLTLGVGPSSPQPQHLSHAPETAAPRFRLLSIAVMVLQENLISNTLERTMIREKAYNTALDYFAFEPSWPVDNIAAVRETVSVLIKFWQSVKDLRNIAVVPQLPTSALEASSSVPRNSTSFWDLALTAESSAAQGSWMNVLASSRGANVRATSLSIPSLQVPQASSKRSSTLAKNKVLLKRRNLILALVRHEVERLCVWANPGSLPELTVSGEEIVSSWINPTQSERHWRSTIAMAFNTSPHLAFQLVNRFKSLDVVSREVDRLIHAHPVAFIDIPDAAQRLAKKECVQQNAHEVRLGNLCNLLYHLLYWRNVPPAAAMIYFYKPFSYHPLTAQFASKAMQSFQPDDILLYIPQLVQTVRYDKLGFARAYILSAGKTSQLLAHQFLWNMEANMYVDEEGTQRDPEIGDILDKLSTEIKAGLSGSALRFYEREFSFFKKVTGISGIIRPFPKAQRKVECLKALQQVDLEPGVYLPSNPDSLLLEIDYKSGRPMQSAAKAPFLAKFKVAKCGTAKVEELNTADDPESLVDLPEKLGESSVWQGAIFKVGDDVRQDMLALQIMQLFKDVFEGAGLQLYLVPYRVVATACGCGVIECVPDSKSRDELGKQTQASLKDYFNSTHGKDDSVSFQQARNNFVISMAAYSLVSYLLQLKDRHNGNIMIDKHGHIIHIDFGFLFESSPGGNMGFEPDLKLTEEMLEVMGGKKSDAYRWFLDLCVQGYLAIRPYQEQIVSLVCLMLDTGFPCFRGNTIEQLRARFRPQLSEKDAAKAIIEVVENSCLNLRTYSYDVIQDMQQKIYYHKKAT